MKNYLIKKGMSQLKKDKQSNTSKPSNIIQVNAESIGIKTLDNEIVDFLNIEIEEKIKSILSQAKKFMRVSKRKTLKVDDLNHSLRFFNFKPLFGYDSFANAEYERIDVVNGLWRPKQNIIDLEDYLSKPIVSCPMQVFPHFHWIAIEGKRPNIPENFIREEIINKLPIEQVNSKDTNVNINQQENLANTNINTQQAKAKVVPPVIHNISKELQIFLENFEQRFRKEIKTSKLNPNPLFSMSKELEVSLNVIETEPGVVELLPYIIEFLMSNLTHKQYIKEAKVHMVILHYVDAILKNPYFYLEPYLHQLVTLLLSLILMENSGGLIELAINVKDYAIKIMNNLYVRYEIKYPNFIDQLLEVFKSNLVPSETNPAYLTAYGAIKSVNALGPSHIISIVLPKMEEIFKSLNYSTDGNFKDLLYENTSADVLSDRMEVDQNDIGNTYQLQSFTDTGAPKISFSLPQFTMQNMPIQSSIFSEISNTNVIKFNENEKNSGGLENCNKDSKMMKSLMKSQVARANSCTVKKAFYAYYALKESATLIFNYASNLESSSANQILQKLNETFGESLIPNLLNSINGNFRSNVGLDLII